MFYKIVLQLIWNKNNSCVAKRLCASPSGHCILAWIRTPLRCTPLRPSGKWFNVFDL